MNTELLNCSRYLLIALQLALFVGCSGGDDNAGIREFMDEVRRKPNQAMTPEIVFDSYQAFTYSATAGRSPFEPPVDVAEIAGQQNKITEIEPPRGHVMQYLEQFKLDSLLMVGALQRGEGRGTWALIRDEEGAIHHVKAGDYLGTRWGRVNSITDNRIHITEIVSDGAHGYLRRPRTIQLEGSKAWKK